MLQEDAGRLRQGSGPQVMVGVRNLMIDECSFSGETSLAAGNRHGHVPPRESGGTRVNLNRRMKGALESKGANHVSRVPESGWPLPLRVLVVP